MGPREYRVAMVLLTLISIVIGIVSLATHHCNAALDEPAPRQGLSCVPGEAGDPTSYWRTDSFWNRACKVKVDKRTGNTHIWPELATVVILNTGGMKHGHLPEFQ